MRVLFTLFISILIFESISLQSKSAASLPDNKMIVTGDNINVRTEPGVNAPVIAQLKIGEMITFLSREEKKVSISGKEGYWTYVDTGIEDTASNTAAKKGWVFGFYLADIKDFKPVARLKKTTISLSEGGMGLTCAFTNDGMYSMQMSLIEDMGDKPREVSAKGRVLRHNNVLFVPCDTFYGGEFFIVQQDGRICYGSCCDNSSPCRP
jgi:uncharacterized protein YgiM (DUF1202 family)